jgi:hypothetical protein
MRDRLAPPEPDRSSLRIDHRQAAGAAAPDRVRARLASGKQAAPGCGDITSPRLWNNVISRLQESAPRVQFFPIGEQPG